MSEHASLKPSRYTLSSFMPDLQEIAEISEHASREWSIEKALEKMHADWQGLAFELADWKATGTYILRGGPVDEAQVGGMRPVRPTWAARRHPSCDFYLAQSTKPRRVQRVGCCSVCMSSFLLDGCSQVAQQQSLPATAVSKKVEDAEDGKPCAEGLRHLP